MKLLRPSGEMAQFSFCSLNSDNTEFPLQMIKSLQNSSSTTSNHSNHNGNDDSLGNNYPIAIENDLDQAVPHLVFSYLTHYGYGQTAQSFLSQWEKVKINDLTIEERFSLSSLDHRSQLRRLISEGKISEAINFIEEFFSQIFLPSKEGIDPLYVDDGPMLKFKLQCQQFIEMVRSGDSVNALEFTESTLSPLAQQDSRFLIPLQEVIVLLAYSEPLESPAAPLLSMEYRDNLIHKIDSAILKRRESALETVLKQVIYLHSLLPQNEKEAIKDLNSLLCMEEIFKNSDISL